MKLHLFFVVEAFLSARAQEWKPPGPDDLRGPCPMMNTLANHGFLPHDGRNITRPTTISAMSGALNFKPSLTTIMFDQALVVNPQPNATFFTLGDLNRHNILEHDASLTRTDTFFGSNHIFNQSVFDESRSYWIGPIIDTMMLANSKLARQITSRASNPEYTFTTKTEQFSLGEVAAPIIAFGDLSAATVNRTLVEYWIQNERLPFELGWTTRETVVGVEQILTISELLAEATSLFTDSEVANAVRRQDLHSGLY